MGNFMGIEDIDLKDFELLDYIFERFIPNHDSIFLYGAGNMGSAYLHFLNNMDVLVEGFIVSWCDKEGELVEGVPKYSVDHFKNNLYKKGKTGILVSLDKKYYGDVLPYLEVFSEDLCFLGKSKEVLLRHEMDIQSCSFQIVDHCNLACFACNVAAPVAKEKYMDYSSFCHDIELLANTLKTSGIDVRIGITGGEALLHPQCCSFIKKAREVFPRSEIQLLTNGILLGAQNEEFWISLRDNRITINLTIYPIKYKNLEYALEKADEYGVKIEKGYADGSKATCKMPLNKQPLNKKWDYALCPLFNYPRMIDGKLMPCCLMPEIQHLNEYFGSNVVISDNDCLDLKVIKSYDELKQFMRKPLDVCKYCALRERVVFDGWKCSKREENEWITVQD